MVVNRQYPLVHHETVLATGKTYLSFEQPENLVDFSDGNVHGVRFHLDIHGTTGTFESFKVYCKFQIAMPDVDGAGFAQRRWYDLQPEQVKSMINEGVDWYYGTSIPSEAINLMPNPSWELNGVGGLDIPGEGGAVTASRPTDGGYRGTTRRRVTWTTGTTAVSGGQGHGDAPVIPGKMYSVTVRVASNRTQRLRVAIRWYNGATGISTEYGDAKLLNATTIQNAHQLSAQGMAPADATHMRIQVYAATGEGAVNWASGDWLDIDSTMVIQGDYVPQAFDGDSLNATWLGTAHASSSKITVTESRESGVVATSSGALPVTVSRSIKDFGQYVRVQVKPVFVNPSSEAGIIYSLIATH